MLQALATTGRGLLLYKSKAKEFPMTNAQRHWFHQRNMVLNDIHDLEDAGKPVPRKLRERLAFVQACYKANSEN